MTRIVITLVLMVAAAFAGRAIRQPAPPAAPPEPLPPAVVTVAVPVETEVPPPAPPVSATVFLRVECWHKHSPGVQGARSEEGPAAGRVRIARPADKFEFFTPTNAKGHAEVWVSPGRYSVWLELGMPPPDAVEIDVQPGLINTVKFFAHTFGV